MEKKKIKRHSFAIALLMGALFSTLALYKNLDIIIGTWMDLKIDVPIFSFINAFVRLWYLWLPSLSSLLLCLLLFLLVYKKGDVKTTFNEFFEEQGGKNKNQRDI